MSIPDWSDLTADQQLTLLSAPNLQVTSGLELLDTNLIATDDLTEFMIPAGGSVRWDGSATVNRTFSAGLKVELAWNRDLVRVYRTYTDDLSGITCRGDKGVFIAAAPTQDLASTPTVWQVTGQDQMAWLNRSIDQSFTFAANSNVFAAIKQVIGAAGVRPFTIDPFQKTALIPTTMSYSLPTSGESLSSASLVTPPLPGSSQQDASGAPTYLQILNDLAALINYQAPYFDSSGQGQLQQNLPFDQRTPTFLFDSRVPNVVSQPRSLTRIPPPFNSWRFLSSSLPDVSGLPAVPTVGNGIVILENFDDGPSSIRQMNGMRFSTTVSLPASSQDALEAQGAAYVAAASRAAVSASVTTRAFPASGHFDVFAWYDPVLADGLWLGAGGPSVLVAATSWVEALDGGSTQWTWQKAV